MLPWEVQYVYTVLDLKQTTDDRRRQLYIVHHGVWAPIS